MGRNVYLAFRAGGTVDILIQLPNEPDSAFFFAFAGDGAICDERVLTGS